jgi:hypothetical protein
MKKEITTIILVVVIILVAIGFAFIPKETIDNLGFAIFLLPIIVLIVIIAFALYLKNSSEKPKIAKKEDKLEKKEFQTKDNPQTKDGEKNGVPRRLQLRSKQPEQKENKKEVEREKENKKNENDKVENVKNEKKENKKSLVDLEKERAQIQEEMKIAEKQFLKHKIDTNTFNSITRESNRKLITIEAEMDTMKNKDLPISQMKKMKYISSDKQSALDGLFNEKINKIHQLKIAEKKYLKRNIDESTYKNIVSDINKEIISIDSRIKGLHKANEVDKIKKELKSSMDEIEKQKSLSKKRTEEQLEEDVLNQLPFRK